MSNTDSFVDEVTDEVRRDRLFALFRKYGWIGVLVVVLIVGGAAWREWQKSVEATRAQSFGDAALAALEKSDPAERAAALAAIAADKDQVAIQALLTAGNPEGDKAARLAALDGLIGDASAPQVYRDLAVLRRVSIAGTDQALADRRTALQGIAVAGRSLRPLAEEQLAYLLLEEGKADEALASLLTLMQDQDTPVAMRQRLASVITALGGVPPEPAASAG
jgi:hypothetical protein